MLQRDFITGKQCYKVEKMIMKEISHKLEIFNCYYTIYLIISNFSHSSVYLTTKEGLIKFQLFKLLYVYIYTKITCV